MTQEQVAEVFGVSCQAISKWKTSASYPDISLLSIIADYFGGLSCTPHRCSFFCRYAAGVTSIFIKGSIGQAVWQDRFPAKLREWQAKIQREKASLAKARIKKLFRICETICVNIQKPKKMRIIVEKALTNS